MILGTAFVLSLIFMVGGWFMMDSSTGMGGIAYLIAGIYPGAAGFVLALIALGIKLVPVVKVASVYIAGVSCVATVSVLAYTLIVLVFNV